jgi:hypothetical protein
MEENVRPHRTHKNNRASTIAARCIPPLCNCENLANPVGIHLGLGCKGVDRMGDNGLVGALRFFGGGRLRSFNHGFI